MRVAQKLKKKNLTVYQKLAKEHGVSVDYVGMIARSQRKAQRGKGADIKKALESLLKD